MDEADKLCISPRAEMPRVLKSSLRKLLTRRHVCPRSKMEPLSNSCLAQRAGQSLCAFAEVMRKTQDLMIPLSRGQVKVRHYIPEMQRWPVLRAVFISTVGALCSAMSMNTTRSPSIWLLTAVVMSCRWTTSWLPPAR